LLPTRVTLGKTTVLPTGEHYEVKLATPSNISPSGSGSTSGQTALLDATELTNIQPTSLVCASCSLPLIHTVLPTQSNTQTQTPSDPFNPPLAPASANGHDESDSIERDRLVYRDLPSEYWTELVDAWMCHHDQALTARIVQNAREGFWPAKGECLVGGSYLLVEESSVVASNLKIRDGKVSCCFYSGLFRLFACLAWWT
jgi:ubiquitin-protein ligase E3 D